MSQVRILFLAQVLGIYMFNTNDYYFWKGDLDKETCDKIINLHSTWKTGTVTDALDDKSEYRETKRKSEVIFATDRWLYDIILPYMETANKEAGWEYDIKSAETIQITRYKKGGFYQWHKDGKSDNLSVYNKPSNPNVDGYVRKLSMSVILNNDFEGGDFEFEIDGKVESPNKDHNHSGSPGDIIVFPSYRKHRVTPITKGVRYSLICWFLGPPFK